MYVLLVLPVIKMMDPAMAAIPTTTVWAGESQIHWIRRLAETTVVKASGMVLIATMSTLTTRSTTAIAMIYVWGRCYPRAQMELSAQALVGRVCTSMETVLMYVLKDPHV